MWFFVSIFFPLKNAFWKEKANSWRPVVQYYTFLVFLCAYKRWDAHSTYVANVFGCKESKSPEILQRTQRTIFILRLWKIDSYILMLSTAARQLASFVLIMGSQKYGRLWKMLPFATVVSIASCVLHIVRLLMSSATFHFATECTSDHTTPSIE